LLIFIHYTPLLICVLYFLFLSFIHAYFMKAAQLFCHLYFLFLIHYTPPLNCVLYFLFLSFIHAYFMKAAQLFWSS